MNSHKNNTLTQEFLKEILTYDPDTGLFTWKIDRNGGAFKGDIAGSINCKGYILIGISGKTYLSSRLAFLYMEGYFPEHEVDHKDRDTTNNKWENLRHVTHLCNSRNQSISKNNTSSVTGVSWARRDKCWRSYISIKGKRIILGSFKTLKEAAQARWEAEVKYGFPNCNTTSSAYLYLQKEC